MMASGFGLSPAETDIVANLVDGKDVTEIAKIRQRTVATVRTQLKSILKKSATRSQSELVRLCLSLSIHQPKSNAQRRYLSSGSVHRLQMGNGAELAYHFYRPVLFVHGMLDGIQCTAAIETLLFEHDIRLIGIERPHFAGSDPYEGPLAEIPSYVAVCAAELIDHLGLKKKIVVMGHMAGAVYAFAIAAHLPEKIKAIVNISGGVPIVSSEQIKSMSIRQRLIAYTARYQDSPYDQNACSDPEILMWLATVTTFLSCRATKPSKPIHITLCEPGPGWPLRVPVLFIWCTVITIRLSNGTLFGNLLTGLVDGAIRAGRMWRL